MWAVLGMVTVDVMAVGITGILDGMKVGGVVDLAVDAQANKDAPVQEVALLVDDIQVASQAGSRLAYSWDTRRLSSGAHMVDAVATDTRGQTSRRRILVYAGDIFITQLGTLSDGASTQITFRNLAPARAGGAVRLQIRNPETDAAFLDRVLPSTPGAQSFTWNGEGVAAKSMPRTYRAEVSWLDGHGKVVQSEQTLFFHGSESQERANTAQIRGQLELPSAAASANTRVDLLDQDGRVIQSTVSTEAGEYRFKNVDEGHYRVRVSRDGYAAESSPVNAEKAQEAKASLKLR
jgi:squalene-hopene/tetraprenyl-beta-curcumene cyclase